MDSTVSQLQSFASHSVPAHEHQQAADLQYFNINLRHPTHIVFCPFLRQFFSDTHNLSLPATFPRLQRSRPPTTTYQVAEDSLQVSVGRRAPGAMRACQQHSHKCSKKKRTARISIYIYKYTGTRQSYHISTSPSSTPEPRSDSSRSMTSSSPPDKRKEAHALPLPFPAEPDPTDGTRVSAQTSPTKPV